jgi:hypothetical protein
MIPVLVPWRTDNGARAEVWDSIRMMWELNGFTDIVTHPGAETGPFNRSAALNGAAELVGDWEIAILADADSWVPRHQIEQAIVMAHRTGLLAAAHNGIWQSVDHAWRQVGRPVRGAQSAILAIRRDLWDAVQGFDERFIGYGYEDRAFWHACNIAAGKPLRADGPVWHLDHGTRDALLTLRKADDAQLEANRILAKRYLDCPDLDHLRDLITERTQVDA